MQLENIHDKETAAVFISTGLFWENYFSVNVTNLPFESHLLLTYWDFWEKYTEGKGPILLITCEFQGL